MGSQSGSQRAQSSGDAGRCPASIIPGERHNGRHEATPGDRLELIWEQEVRGSNPRIPTAIFEYIISPVGAIGAACVMAGRGLMSLAAVRCLLTLAPTRCPRT